jgi:hypothetical protein
MVWPRLDVAVAVVAFRRSAMYAVRVQVEEDPGRLPATGRGAAVRRRGERFREDHRYSGHPGSLGSASAGIWRLLPVGERRLFSY